jgi:hypothetical protein
MVDLLIRFGIGGVVVSLFAALCDVFRPKSFAGLFAAAPSIALATLGLTVLKQGHAYPSIEARSMILGAAAFLVYSWTITQALMRSRIGVLVSTLAAVPLWLGISFGLWGVLLRGR